MYVARSKGDVIFLVRIYSGCPTYYPRADVDSFSNMEQMRVKMEDYARSKVGGYERMVKALFEKQS